MSNTRGMPCELAGMAKQQRSVQLPPSIFDLAESFENGTGARFNRQVLAALLQFYFSDDAGPDSTWIRLAVSIEKGSIPLEDVPFALADEFIMWANQNLAMARADARDGENKKDHKARIEAAKETLDNWEQSKRMWEERAKAAGGRMNAIKAHLTRKPWRFDDNWISTGTAFGGRG